MYCASWLAASEHESEGQTPFVGPQMGLMQQLQAGHGEETHLEQFDHERVDGGRQTRPQHLPQVIHGGGIDITINGDHAHVLMRPANPCPQLRDPHLSRLRTRARGPR